MEETAATWSIYSSSTAAASIVPQIHSEHDTERQPVSHSMRQKSARPRKRALLDQDCLLQSGTCRVYSCLHKELQGRAHGIFSKVRHPPSQRNGILVGMSIPKVERPKSPSTWRLHARETCSVCKSYRNLSQPAHQFAGRLLFLRSVQTTLCVQG